MGIAHYVDRRRGVHVGGLDIKNLPEPYTVAIICGLAVSAEDAVPVFYAIEDVKGAPAFTATCGIFGGLGETVEEATEAVFQALAEFQEQPRAILDSRRKGPLGDFARSILPSLKR